MRDRRQETEGQRDRDRFTDRQRAREPQRNTETQTFIKLLEVSKIKWCSPQKSEESTKVGDASNTAAHKNDKVCTNLINIFKLGFKNSFTEQWKLIPGSIELEV